MKGTLRVRVIVEVTEPRPNGGRIATLLDAAMVELDSPTVELVEKVAPLDQFAATLVTKSNLYQVLQETSKRVLSECGAMLAKKLADTNACPADRRHAPRVDEAASEAPEVST